MLNYAIDSNQKLIIYLNNWFYFRSQTINHNDSCN